MALPFIRTRPWVYATVPLRRARRSEAVAARRARRWVGVALLALIVGTPFVGWPAVGAAFVVIMVAIDTWLARIPFMPARTLTRATLATLPRILQDAAKAPPTPPVPPPLLDRRARRR